MILGGSTKEIRVFLDGAVTTNELEWTVSYADHDRTGKMFTPADDEGVTTGTTPLTIVAAPTDTPARPVQRQVKQITITNTDTSAAGVWVEKYNGTARRKIIHANLDPDWSLQWEPGGTWHVYDENGVLQVPVGTGGGGGTFEAGVSTGGNTSGDTGIITSRLVLVGGDNITLSGSTAAGRITVTISGGAGGGGLTNIRVSGGTTSNLLSAITFGNANGVSFGLNASTMTASIATSLTAVRISAGTTSNLLSAMTFADGGGVSFGLNASTLTATIATSLTAIRVSAGTTSNLLSALTFADGNGVSFGINASTVTGSVLAQSNPQVTLFATGNTTQSSTGTSNVSSLIFRGDGLVSIGITNGSVVVSGIPAFSADASSTFKTITFQDSNGISWSNNAGALRVTHALQFTSATSAITSNALHTSASRVMNILAATNNTGGGTASLSSNVSFSAANGLTFYTSAGNAIVASYTVPTQTNQQMTLFATGNTTQSSTGTTNASSIIFAGSGAVSVGITGGSILVSAPNTIAQTNQTLGIYGSSQTTGSASSGTHDARSLSLIGAGIISIGNHSTSVGGTTTGVIISATQSNQAFSAAGGSSAFQTLSFSDNAHLSWTNNAGQVAAAPIKATMFATSNTTQSSTGTQFISSLIFAGQGIASVGITNGSIVISVPAGGGAGDGGNVVGVSTGGDTLGTTGTTSTGTMILQGANSLTLSQITGAAGIHTIVIKPAMSQLTAGAGISLSTNGSTISIINIGAGTGVTTGTTQGTTPAATLSTNGLSILFPVDYLSYFQPEYMGATVAQSMAVGTAYVQPFVVGNYISMYRMQMQLQNTTQQTLTQSFSGSVSGGAGSTGATGRVGSTGTFWLMSRESTGTVANSSNIISFYSNSFSQQFDMFATVSNSTNASSATARWSTSAVLTFVSSIGTNSWTTGTVTASGSSSFTSTSTNGQTFSSNAGTMSFGSSVLSGVRALLAPMFTSLEPGEYWLAQNWSTSSASSTYSLQRLISFASSVVCFTSNTSGFLRIGATQTTANSNLIQGWGSHSASSIFTTTVPLSNISGMSQHKTWFNMLAQVS